MSQAASVPANASTLGEQRQLITAQYRSSAMKQPVPRWLHVGDTSPADDIATELWRQAATQPSAKSIYLLPCCALVGKRAPRPPIIYANWAKGLPRPSLKSLAVLPPCDVGSSLLDGLPLPRRLNLRGRRVLDNTLLGDNSPQALREFIDAMAAMLRRGETDYVMFRDLDAASPLRSAIADAAQPGRFTVFEPGSLLPHWWIRFPDKPQEYWSQFSKKTRYNFRYRAKHLDHTIRCLRTPEQVPEFAKRVESLIARTWQHRRLERLFDVEERIEIWLQFAQAGAFRSYLLEQGDRVIAFTVGLQWNGVYIYDETGYDPADAPKSPGQVLLYRMLEDLIATDTPRLLDFGFGDSEYKRIFANYQTSSGPVALVRRSFLPMTTMMLLRAKAAAGRYARRTLGKAGLLTRLRHLYRGHGGAALKQTPVPPETDDPSAK